MGEKIAQSITNPMPKIFIALEEFISEDAPESYIFFISLL